MEKSIVKPFNTEENFCLFQSVTVETTHKHQKRWYTLDMLLHISFSSGVHVE